MNNQSLPQEIEKEIRNAYAPYDGFGIHEAVLGIVAIVEREKQKSYGEASNAAFDKYLAYSTDRYKEGFEAGAKAMAEKMMEKINQARDRAGYSEVGKVAVWFIQESSQELIGL